MSRLTRARSVDLVTLRRRSRISSGNGRQRSIHLELEPLEERTLLSVSISGSVFNDLVGGGTYQKGEPGLAGVTVYLDLNHSGVFGGTTVTQAGSNALTVGDPLAAGSVPPDAFATLNVSGLPSNASDITVSLDVSSTSSGPVLIGLASPLGATLSGNFDTILFSGVNLLLLSPGSFSGTLSDKASTRVTLATAANITGNFEPDQPFTTPQGHIYEGNPNGSWDLLFYSEAGDLVNGSHVTNLTLNSWSITYTVPEPSVQTDAKGAFSFTGLAPGNYTVGVVPPQAFVATSPASVQVHVSDGQSASAGNFGVAANQQLVGAPDISTANQLITTGSGVHQGPSVAVDPNNAKHLAMAYMDYSLLNTGYAGIAVTESTDGGNTWQKPSTIPLPADFSQAAGNPVAQFDANGRIYVTFMAATFRGPAQPDLIYPHKSTQVVLGKTVNSRGAGDAGQ